MCSCRYAFLVTVYLICVLGVSGFKKDTKSTTFAGKEDCEVCYKVLSEFDQMLDESARKKEELIEKEFKEYCKKTDEKSMENRFCYYVGGLKQSATGILRVISKPMLSYKPVEYICRDLAKIDKDICGIKFKKPIDFKNINLKTLKVKELKNILNEWDEVCSGCVEKSDYIARIEELKPKYVREEL